MEPSRLSVVLVRPQYSGNVGSVARAMMNFGVTRLVMVAPCPMTDEGRDRAVHAQQVLESAEIVATTEAALAKFDHCVAFSARVTDKDKTHRRNAVPLPDFVKELAELDGSVALVFGPEDDGLANEDVERCDVVVTIPTSPMYESMNLAAAVTVALFALSPIPSPHGHVPSATHAEKEILARVFAATVDALALPEHRRGLTANAFRRVVGRSGLTKWEFHRLMGVYSTTLKRLGKWPLPDLDVPKEPDGSGAPEDAEFQPSVGDY
ncbi:MAG: RNA methyltransferase [Thermoplasmatota archaeon]